MIFRLFLFGFALLGHIRLHGTVYAISPTSQEWKKLNESVQGRLHEGVPFARPCFFAAPGLPGVADRTECGAIINGYSNHSRSLLHLLNENLQRCSSIPCFPLRGVHERKFLHSLRGPCSDRTTRQTEWEACQSTGAQCLLDSANPSDPEAFSFPRICAQGSVPEHYVGYPCLLL